MPGWLLLRGHAPAYSGSSEEKITNVLCIIRACREHDDDSRNRHIPFNSENAFCPNATSAPLTATAITVSTVAIGAIVEITVPIIAWSCANSGVISAV